jgi:predicted PurR-regulated permease PerM
VRRMEDWVFLALVAAVSLAFMIVVAPLSGAVLWAIIAAIVFFPLRNRLLRAMPGHRNRCALLALLVIVAVVIIPATFLTTVLIQEANSVYGSISSGEIDLDRYFDQAMHHVPSWASGYIKPLGLTNIDALLNRIAGAFANSFERVAESAVMFGQGALTFLLALGVMLYLTFFLLRDGDSLIVLITNAVPLRNNVIVKLIATFASVIRATIKGSLVVALIQGTLGGLTLWALGFSAALLWAVIMTILAFLPVVGTALIWVPAAIYLFATGAVWQALVLTGVGLLIIGLADNVVRPILVGRETRLPDYLVLITTLGGLAAFGANGVVIGPLIAALFLAVWEIFTAERASRALADSD